MKEIENMFPEMDSLEQVYKVESENVLKIIGQ